ncbi:MAG: DUF4384 domain-containing protein [Candidatus Schekmanbacteria bacterium]|nr:DUF4384 domain-containing protein [Candidatus Schekmanbacteria bacterium]
MRRIAVSVLSAVLAVASATAWGDGSRDLFLSYQPSSSANTAAGQPGAKVTIERNRGGQIGMVAPTSSFRSGDEVRFHFAVNFAGYVAVVNIGSTGKKALLFPSRGVSNAVTHTSDYQVPREAGGSSSTTIQERKR